MWLIPNQSLNCYNQFKLFYFALLVTTSKAVAVNTMVIC